MDIVDELMTPGCPQCAIKHLSAAIFHRARHATRDDKPQLATGYMVSAAVAWINLVEVQTGYKSHLWYAVGALVDAEELAFLGGDARYAAKVREARLILERRGLAGVEQALGQLFTCDLNDVTLEVAHASEARRELPRWGGWPGPCGYGATPYAELIERIREDFMVVDSEEAPGASAEAAGKGGESDMATKKAAKADPKAAKAAAKGGKTKKACGKGGKCKK